MLPSNRIKVDILTFIEISLCMYVEKFLNARSKFKEYKSILLQLKSEMQQNMQRARPNIFLAEINVASANNQTQVLDHMANKKKKDKKKLQGVPFLTADFR